MSQFILHILLAPWIPTALNMLEDVPCQYPIIKDLIMDDLVGWVLMGLQLQHLTLLLLREMCCTDKGSLLQSVRWQQG